jgi:hypothetical protein
VPRVFAASVRATPFPERVLASAPEAKWVARHGWMLEAPRPMPRAALAESLDRFLSHLPDVEDVRFKVTRAKVERETLRGVLGIQLVGRDPNGRREWVRGRAEVSARRDAKGTFWIEELRITAIESLVATRDMFSEVSAPAGIVERYAPRAGDGISGHGAAAGDVDGDGLVDLYLTDVTGRTGCRLWLNRGDGTFRSVAGAPLYSPGTATTGALLLDYDNDGDADLFVAAFGSTQRLFRNEIVPSGRLRFTDVSQRAGVAVTADGYSAVAGDIDRDGFSDIYVTCYRMPLLAGPEAAAIRERPLLESLTQAKNGPKNLLFLSRGDGTFREAAAEWGVADERFSLAAELADLDGDDRLDLVVANDYGGGSTIYRNLGDRFADVGAERGLLDQRNGMGVSLADYDNDGDLDVHITNMSSTAGQRIFAALGGSGLKGLERAEAMTEGNALYENLGQGRFREKETFAANWAWGGGFVDLDNDGWQDLHAPNGYLSGKSKADT